MTTKISQPIETGNGKPYLVAGLRDGKDLQLFCVDDEGRLLTKPASELVGSVVEINGRQYRLTGAGAVYESIVKLGKWDEDHSYSGVRATGETRREKEQRIYLQPV